MHEDEEGSPALQLCPNNVRSKTKTEFKSHMVTVNRDWGSDEHLNK
jgi:hypothetical protein